MSRRWPVAGALSVAFALGAPASATGAPAKDRDLAAALVFWHSQKCTFSPDTSQWIHGWRLNALYGNCRAEDGHDQHVDFFDRGRFVGTDGLGTSSEVIAMWRDDRTFAFLYVLYRPEDPLCCPTGGGAIVRFRWSG